MVNVGVSYLVGLGPLDGWTVKTKDGKLSAHYENTIAITDGEPEILRISTAKCCNGRFVLLTLCCR